MKKTKSITMRCVLDLCTRDRHTREEEFWWQVWSSLIVKFVRTAHSR